MEAFDFKEFWQGLSSAEKKQLADEAETTKKYIVTHLVYKRRVPSRNLMNNLHKACVSINPEISKDQLVSFFYSAA